MSDLWKRARNVLNSLEKARTSLDKWMKRKCDWDDLSDVNEYRRGQAAVERVGLLPADRRCPCCGNVVVESWRWVVLAMGGVGDVKVACKKCFRRALKRRTVDVTVEEKIFECETRWRVSGEVLKKCRAAAGLSLVDMSRKLGVSKPTLIRAESGLTEVRVSGEVVERVLIELVKYGVKTGDNLVFDE